MDDPIDRVEISGSTMAMILRELVSSRRDFDGLLFGRLLARSVTDFQDDGDAPAAANRREDRTAIITGCCCSGTLMSFYDGAARVDERRINRLAGNRARWGGDWIIGWMVGRRGCSMRPSMREAAVTASLSAEKDASTPAPPLDRTDLHQHKERNAATVLSHLDRKNPDNVSLGLPYSASSSSSVSSINQHDDKVLARDHLRPCLFLLFTESTAENSIQTHEYRAFQFHSQTGHFKALPLVVRNVGRAGNPSQQGGLYGSFVAASPLPWLATSFGGAASGGDEEVDSWRSGGRPPPPPPSSSPSSLRQQRQQALLDMYADGVGIDQLQKIARTGGGIQEIEMLYSRMLVKMQKLSQEVRHGSQALQEKKTKHLKS